VKNFCLNLASSGETIEINAPTLADAIEHANDSIRRLLDPPDIVWANDESADGLNDDDEQCWKLLIWGSEESAHGDNGSRSIAQLEWVGDTE
jgi:hypothetical protein